MASPVGHYLLAVTITQGLARNDRERKQGLLISTIAILADFDLAAGLLYGYIWEFHRGISHTIALAAVIGIIALIAFMVWKVRSPYYLAALVFLAYASHPVLDYFGFDNARVPGVPLLWPLSSELYQSPWILLPSIISFGDAKLGVDSIVAVLRELTLLLPLYAMVYTLKSSRIPWPRQMAWMYGGVFIAVVGVSLIFL